MDFRQVWKIKREIEEYLVKHLKWVNDPSSRQIIHTAYNHVESAVEISKRVFVSSNWNGPNVGIRDALCKLKGAIESHISKKMDPGTHNLEKEIDIFTQKIHNLEEYYADDLYKFPGGEDEDEDEEVVSIGDKSKMVGFSDHYNDLKESLTNSAEFKVVSLCGMPGIGKTTLAREIFEDPETVERFPCRVWVKVGRKCGFKEMLQRILVAVIPDHQMEEDEDIIWRLNECLKGKKYLIVLDDVWDIYASSYLYDEAYISSRNELIHIFPSEYNGGRLLVISRMQQLKEYYYLLPDIEMRLMDKEESWHLLRDKVFGQERCPSQLEKIGRKIVEKCEGLPLTIVTVANLLSKADKTVEYWNEVATRKKHQLFKVAYDEILKVLLPSYINLPPSLQMCFMYIGVFPQYYDIPRSKIINVWHVDGFLQHFRKSSTDYEEIKCLEELVSNHMVMVRSTTINTLESVGERQIKTCRLHTSLWHLSNREARRSKFSCVLESFDDAFGEDIKSQPRLSFHTNVLFAIKDVHKSVENNCASTAHSLFCYGPYLPYQVPICFGLRLLHRLDALTIRLYEFPLEVLQLIELRYLALTLNGNLPAAISQLAKLQFLIVHPHQSIKSIKESSYLPMEIWNMVELQHLQVMGKDLPNPCGASLKKLRTVSRLSPNSCSVDVFKGILDINKLGIQVELSHENDGEPLSCLAHISHLENLQSLKCVVVNPKSIPSFYPLSYFPSGLTKLTLNGLGHAWEEMNKIGSLESLRMLKLQNYAFRGPEWNVGEEQFVDLWSLIIEDTDMERWRIGNEILGTKELIIKRCYKLKEIDGVFFYPRIYVEMIDCNPLATEQIRLCSSDAEVRVSCSWYDKKDRA